jgi:hypothetical protein
MKEYDELNMAIKTFKTRCTLLFYSSCSCTAWNDFGGGCEMSLHDDKVVAAETHMGLVEFELRFLVVVDLKNWHCVCFRFIPQNDVELNVLQEYF